MRGGGRQAQEGLFVLARTRKPELPSPTAARRVRGFLLPPCARRESPPTWRSLLPAVSKHPCGIPLRGIDGRVLHPDSGPFNHIFRGAEVAEKRIVRERGGNGALPGYDFPAEDNFPMAFFAGCSDLPENLKPAIPPGCPSEVECTAGGVSATARRAWRADRNTAGARVHHVRLRRKFARRRRVHGVCARVRLKNPALAVEARVHQVRMGRDFSLPRGGRR